MLKRVALLIIAVSMILVGFTAVPVKTDSTSLENRENFSITTSTYDQSLLVGSVTGYTLTAGDVLFISWKGNPSPLLSAPRGYILTDYQFHGWDYFRKCIFLDPASRGWLMRNSSWEMTLNYSITSSGTYYVIIDNPNWIPDILPPSIDIMSYQVVQNYPNSYYLTVKTDPIGVTAISGDGWYLRGYDKILTAPSAVTVSPSLQYRFEYWDVDGVSYGIRVNPITVDINPNKTATAHYVLYQLLEHKEPFLVHSSTHEQGLLVGSVDGYSLAVGDTLFVSWKGHTVSMGGTLRFYLLNDYQFQGWTWNLYLGGNPTRGYLIRSDSWEQTVNYQVNSSDKYYVIIECVGIHHEIIPSKINVTSYDAFKFLPKMFYLSVKTDPFGIVTIDGEGWYTEGSTPVLTAPATVSVSPNTQYRFEYWDVDGISYSMHVNPITVGMITNHTATAHYVLQYQVSFGQTGLDSSATSTVVTVNDVPKMLSDLPYTCWVDDGRVIVFSYNETVLSSTLGKRFALRNVTGATSPIMVSSPLMIIGNYKAQYYLTVTSPYDSPTPTSGWFDAGTPLTALVISPWLGPSGVQHICTGWTGSGSVPASGSTASMTFTINEPSSITWTWKTQYKLTVKTDPPGLSPGPTPTTDWYDESTDVILTAQTVSGYTFKYWDIDDASEGSGVNPITVHIDNPHTATAHYETGAPPPPPVGGKAIPIIKAIDKPETPTLWIWLTTIILLIILTVVYITKRKRHTKIDYQTNNQRTHVTALR